MEVILEILRLPVIISILAIGVGVGVGVSCEMGRRSSYWGGVGAVCIVSASLASLAPFATLAPSGAIVGFSVVVLTRETWTRRTRARQSQNQM